MIPLHVTAVIRDLHKAQDCLEQGQLLAAANTLHGALTAVLSHLHDKPMLVSWRERQEPVTLLGPDV